MGQVLRNTKMAELLIGRLIQVESVWILPLKALIRAELAQDLYTKFYEIKG
jgi:hypothetical protein